MRNSTPETSNCSAEADDRERVYAKRSNTISECVPTRIGGTHVPAARRIHLHLPEALQSISELSKRPARDEVERRGCAPYSRCPIEDPDRQARVSKARREAATKTTDSTANVTPQEPS
jgi:hypothetical protein